jgi:hypothetical protein
MWILAAAGQNTGWVTYPFLRAMLACLLAGTQTATEPTTTDAALEGTDVMSSGDVHHPGTPLASSSAMSVAEVHEAGRQRAAREAEVRGGA